jgi:L-aspartate oxidase
MTAVDATSLTVEHHRLLVVGAGVAGLSAALALGDATVLVDTDLGGGSSPWAQGGLAAAIGADDTPLAHAEDTLAVSAGLGAAGPVRRMTVGAPAAVDWLRGLGACFDVDASGALVLGREAGHRARRIVHARGDATGAEIMRTLRAAVRARPGITVREWTTVVDLVRDGADRVVGVLALEDGRLRLHLAGAVILATGGYGYLFARTTNPPQVAGAAVAMAARASGAVADVEMVQFHPTALAVPGADPLPLLTEALRGEGAVLVNQRGERFMVGVHPDAELAPRDVVARANYAQLRAGNTPYLDARAAVGSAFPDRFPTVFALAGAHGIDPRVDLLPCSPAAHYCMGGVAADEAGRTSLPGLWAVGEAASTGAHGANRLASNSMLEGVVMGCGIAAALAGEAGHPVREVEVPSSAFATGCGSADVLAAHRRLLWERAGVVRDADGLAAGRRAAAELADAAGADVRSRNANAVAGLLFDFALERRESRGAHFRADFPQVDPAFAARRVVAPAPEPTTRLVLHGDRAVPVTLVSHR